MAPDPSLVPERLREPVVAADVAMLTQAHQSGRSVHAMGSAAAFAAAHYGIYTAEVATPRHPICFFRYVQERNLARVHSQLADRANGVFEQTAVEQVHGQLADRATRIFAQTEGTLGRAAKEGRLGGCLADTFGAITHIHAHDVHDVPAKPRKVNGKLVTTKVVATYMDLTVATAKEKTRLHIALQGLMSDPDKPFHPIIEPLVGNSPEKRFTVRVRGLTEYDVRMFNTIVGALVGREDRENLGVVLPEEKWPLADLEAVGRTFPPVFRKRLVAIDTAHRNLQTRITATYRNYPRMKPGHKERIDVSDRAAALGGLRRPFNGLIHHLRGDRHLNMEQDPDRQARLPIEKGIDLARPPVTPADVVLGPVAAYPLTRSAKVREKVREILEDAQEHRVRAGVKLAGFVVGTVFGFGWSTVVAPLITNSHILWEAGKSLPNDWQDYRQQRALAAGGRVALDRLITDLHARD